MVYPLAVPQISKSKRDQMGSSSGWDIYRDFPGAYEEMVAAVQLLKTCREVSESVTLIRIEGRHQLKSTLPDWPEICDILARCTNVDHWTLPIFDIEELLLLLAAFGRYRYDRLRHMSVQSNDPIKARECLWFLELAPNLQSCIHLPPTSDRLTSADVALARPLRLKRAEILSDDGVTLLSLLLSHRCTAREVLLASSPRIFGHLSSLDWTQVGSLSVHDLTIITSPLGGDHAAFAAFALACRSLRRLELRGGAWKMLQILQAVVSQPDSRLLSLALSYGIRGTAPQSWRRALALVPRVVGLRAFAVHIPTRHRAAFEEDVAELRQFCRLRRIIFTTGEVRPR